MPRLNRGKGSRTCDRDGMPDSAQLISTKNTAKIVGILFIAGTVAGIFSVVPVIVATTPAFALAMLLFSCIFY